MYIQANIGRNVTVPASRTASTYMPETTEPMGDTAWDTFQIETEEQIKAAILDSGALGDTSELDFQFHTGVGEWDGVEEESAHVSVYFDTKPGQVNAARLQEHLADRLADLASQYGQDAIASVVTDSHLATR